MRHYLWIFVMLCGCGEPILKNAPKPDPGAVAGAAAAAAAAATLADPQGAGRRQEQATRSDPDNRGVDVKETAPADAFDRLDHPRDAGTDAAQPARSPSSQPVSPPPAVPPPPAIPLRHAPSPG
ncbi:MAG TPA: hypothetical protein VHT91_24325 [Kofleriaceae bacterium]|jgi:hypothetical protein|nr:hypothetical protein [Kofleriaceae bacterium]